jgi:catechol 2,3-dioxygenase-like lactoylglutathione lyase family enzyme
MMGATSTRSIPEGPEGKQMSNKPHSIHHVNIPIADAERTLDWYGKVFGLREMRRPFVQGGAPGVDDVLLMTRGNFGVHCTIHENPPDIKPHHFCVEVEDWDGFMAHLGSLGIEHSKVFVRPQNDSKSTYIYDPDDNIVELMFHPDWDNESPMQPD